VITVRPESPSDYKAIYEINERAFKRSDEALLIENLRESDYFIPELSFVAEKNKQVIGHIVFSLVDVRNDKGAVSQILSLAPMAVSPDFQKQGVGFLLVKQGLKKCRESGFKAVVVVGHPEYYPRFGFTSARAKGLTLPFDAPDEAFLVAELLPGALEDISGAIVYPPAFDDVT